MILYIYIYTVIIVTQKSLNPPLPGEVAVSFYVHATKLVFALYHVNNSPHRKLEITDRFQVSIIVAFALRGLQNQK